MLLARARAPVVGRGGRAQPVVTTGGRAGRGSRRSASAIHRLSSWGVSPVRVPSPRPGDAVGRPLEPGGRRGLGRQALMVLCSSAFAEPIAILRGLARSLTGSTTLSTPLS